MNIVLFTVFSCIINTNVLAHWTTSKTIDPYTLEVYDFNNAENEKEEKKEHKDFEKINPSSQGFQMWNNYLVYAEDPAYQHFIFSIYPPVFSPPPEK